MEGADEARSGWGDEQSIQSDEPTTFENPRLSMPGMWAMPVVIVVDLAAFGLGVTAALRGQPTNTAWLLGGAILLLLLNVWILRRFVTRVLVRGRVTSGGVEGMTPLGRSVGARWADVDKAVVLKDRSGRADSVMGLWIRTRDGRQVGFPAKHGRLDAAARRAFSEMKQAGVPGLPRDD